MTNEFFHTSSFGTTISVDENTVFLNQRQTERLRTLLVLRSPPKAAERLFGVAVAAFVLGVILGAAL